jgi:hypothetical protein
MRPETVLSYLHAQPFRSFRIVLNSGKFYDVRHPDFIEVGRDVCIYYHRPTPHAPFELWESLSLLLIQNIEHLDAPAPADGQGNGQT